MNGWSRLCACAVALALSACSVTGPRSATTGQAAAPSGHSHDHATGARVSLPVGDGTRAYEVGYTLRDVRLPQRVDEPGRLSFVIESFRGRPQTRFLTEQSKRMHVYVVREDLAVFRHVHPQMRPDGTWVGNLTLPEPGDYRVVAEFVARDDGGNGDHVLLGDRADVPGSWRPRPVTDVGETVANWAVEARVVSDLAAGSEQELRIRLTSPDGGSPTLGQYLGTFAHLTGFHTGSGAVVHMHPLGAPEPSQQGSELVFHADLPVAGDYVLFLQVPVDGFLHTLPLLVTAS